MQGAGRLPTGGAEPEEDAPRQPDPVRGRVHGAAQVRHRHVAALAHPPLPPPPHRRPPAQPRQQLRVDRRPRHPDRPGHGLPTQQGTNKFHVNSKMKQTFDYWI